MGHAGSLQRSAAIHLSVTATMIGSLLGDAGVGIGVDCYKRGSAILVIAEPSDTSSLHKLRVYTSGHAGA